MVKIPNVKVSNMCGPNGNVVKNQFEISINSVGIYFQSYDSIIAIKTPDGIVLDKNYWDYSVTTGRYRNIFLRECKKDTELKIKSGEYKIADLN